MELYRRLLPSGSIQFCFCTDASVVVVVVVVVVFLSKSKSCYDRRSVGQFFLVSSPLLGLMTRFFNTARHLRVYWYGEPSLTRRRVCLLQLVLSSPAQSFSGPSPAGLMTTFYSLRFETPPTWRTRSLYFYPPGTGWPGYISRHWVLIFDVFEWLLIASQSQSHVTTDQRSVGQSVLE
jgi:hypothetical protein